MYVKKAVDEGGHIATGGEIPDIPNECSNGWYFSPTVIENLPQNSQNVSLSGTRQLAATASVILLELIQEYALRVNSI